MAEEDKLFQLIKSLNKSEKGYFKKFAFKEISDGSNNYMNLFDLLDNMKVYDEVKLKKHFLGKKEISQLYANKHYLYKVIRQSLRAYYEKSNPTHVVTGLLQDVRILFEKALFAQAREVLASARAQAEHHALYTKLLEVIDWEFRLLNTETSLSRIALLQEKFAEARKRILEIINNIHEYEYLFKQLFIIVRRKNFTRDKKEQVKLNGVISDPLLSDEKKALTSHAKELFFNTWAIYYGVTGNYEKSYVSGKKLVELFESSPVRMADLPRAYISALNNFIVSCLQLKRFDGALYVIEKMRNFHHPSLGVQVEVFQRLSEYELNYYQLIGEFEKGMKLIPGIEKEMEKYKGKLNKILEISFYMQSAGIYVGTGNYKRALYFLNRLFSVPDTSQREDIHCCARMLNLIVHFELGNQLVLPYILKSTYRFFYKRKVLYEFETVFLKNIRKLANANTRKELKAVYAEMHTQLVSLSAKQYEKGVFELFDFISWLESKIENKSLAEIVKRKVLKG